MSRWDERFAQDGWAFGTEPNDFLRAHADLIPPGRVLSLGEGEGRNAVFLAGLGYEVVGLDLSAVGLRKAKKLAADRGVSLETRLGAAEDLPWDEERWQGIVAIFFHPPADVRRAVHRKVVRALEPGGVYVLEAYTPRQLDFGTGGPPHLDRLMTLEELRGELAGLTFVVAREVEREIREGRLHTGRGAVVQVVARKGGGGAAGG